MTQEVPPTDSDNGREDERERAGRAWELWQRARDAIAISTEGSLSQAITLLHSATTLISVPNLLAMLYHDLGIAHWRLAKLGQTEHLPQAIDAVLQACLLDINSLFGESDLADLNRDASLLASVLPNEGVSQREVHDTQVFLDRYFSLPATASSPVRLTLQEAVVAAYLHLAQEAESSSLRSGLASMGRESLHKAAALAQLSPPESRAEVLGRLKANEVFLAIMESHALIQFHTALDLAFQQETALEVQKLADNEDQLSYRARLLIVLHNVSRSDLTILDRARLRYRLWGAWAKGWIDGLDGVTRDPNLKPPVSDWLMLLLQIEQDEILIAAGETYLNDGQVPVVVRQYAMSLIADIGYSPGLLTICIARQFGIVNAGLDSILPDPAREQYRVNPEEFLANLAFYRIIGTAVSEGQRGSISALEALQFIADRLPLCRQHDGHGPVAGAITAAALRIVHSVENPEFAHQVMEIACKIRDDHGDDLTMDQFLEAARVCQEWANNRDPRWLVRADRWLTEAVSRTANRVNCMSREDPEYPNALYQHLWSLFHLAKVQAGSAEVTSAERTLALAIGLLPDLERVAVGDPGVVAARAEASRVRTMIALAREDYRAALLELAAEMRLFMDNPEANIGSPVLTASNLLSQVLNNKDMDSLTTIQDELRVASNLALQNMGYLLNMGGIATAALAALTSVNVRQIVGLSQEQVAVIVNAMRTHSPDSIVSGIDIDSGAILAINPFYVTLAETLQWYVRLIAEGHSVPAIALVSQWLGTNIDRPSFSIGARFMHHIIATRIAEIGRHIPGVPDELGEFLTYLVGESARHAGLLTTAQQYLEVVYGQTRTSSNERWRDSVECDYAALRVIIGAAEGNQIEARRWLEVLFSNTLGASPEGTLSVATALIEYIRAFGPEGVESYLSDVMRRLQEGARSEVRPQWEQEAKYLLASVDVALLSTDERLISPTVQALEEVLNRRDLVPRFEAALTRAKVNCLVALDRTLESRSELQRLTFLQDEMTASAASFDFVSYEDFFGDSGIAAACAALDAGEYMFALDMLEQGRVRLLHRLREGVEAGGYAEAVRLDADGEEASGGDEYGNHDGKMAGEAPDLMSVVRVYSQYENSVRTSRMPEDAWRRVFRDVGAREVIATAQRVGIVAYQIVHNDKLRILWVMNGKILLLGPMELPLAPVFDHAMSEVQQAIQHSWRDAISASRDTGNTPEQLSPVLVTVGPRPELACLSETTIDALRAEMALTDGGLVQIPSVRFVGDQFQPRINARNRVNVLHIGDMTNTLIGPWLEAAALASCPSLDGVRSFMTGAFSFEEFEESASDAAVVVASCHGSYDPDGLLNASLGAGTKGVSIGELVASNSLSNVDMLFLASCEMGRRSGVAYERESISFANAALVSGCRYVAAPVLPVNDLVTAVLVVEFCRVLRDLGSVQAYHFAVGKVRAMSSDDFIESIEELWQSLKTSAFVQMMPWPLQSIEKILRQLRDDAVEHQLWRSSTFLISEGAV